MHRPLAGIRVVDLTRLLPGPFLTQLFVDLGADVTKVEEVGTGDYARDLEPATFGAVNRGKKSIALDLKARGGAGVVLRLAARADVLVESFRPGVMDRLGLSDAALVAANPRLIRASLVGYPPGPMRDAVGHDINYEALAGILAMQGEPERPLLPAVPLADLAGALYGAVGILAALHERTRTGAGQRVEVALSDAALAMNGFNLALASEGHAPTRGRWPLAGGLPNYGLYRCADGAWLALGALEEKFWERFVGASGVSGDADRADLERLFAERPRPSWLRSLGEAGVPVAPVLEPAEAAAQHGVPMPGAPLTGARLGGAIPSLGADTLDVLRDAGLSDSDITALREAGAVR